MAQNCRNNPGSSLSQLSFAIPKQHFRWHNQAACRQQGGGRDTDNICTIGLLPSPNVLTAWTGDRVCRMFLLQGFLTNRTIFLPHIRLSTVIHRNEVSRLKSAGLSLLHRRDLRPGVPIYHSEIHYADLTVLTRERNGSFYHRATYNSSMLPQNFLNNIALEQLFSLEVIVG